MFGDLKIDLPRLGEIVKGLLDEFEVIGILGKDIVEKNQARLEKLK